MSTRNGLPAAMVMLSYGTAGAAICCSYFMLRQIMQQDGVQVGGGVITGLWPFVVLGSSFALARMTGHLWVRKMFGAMLLMGCGFIYLESISVGTSYFSALRALQLKQQHEISTAAGSETTAKLSEATATAATTLAAQIESMEGTRLFKRSNETAERLAGVIQQHKELMQMQAESAKVASVTAQTMTTSQQKLWALAAAISLSIAAIFPSLGLGLTSDAAKSERVSRSRNPLDTYTDSPVSGAPPAKKPHGLHR